MRRRKKNYGCIAVALGVGLLMAVCFPANCLVVMLSVLIIACGYCLCKK